MTSLGTQVALLEADTFEVEDIAWVIRSLRVRQAPVLRARRRRPAHAPPCRAAARPAAARFRLPRVPDNHRKLAGERATRRRFESSGRISEGLNFVVRP